jgi:hypothetical protein
MRSKIKRLYPFSRPDNKTPDFSISQHGSEHQRTANKLTNNIDIHIRQD